MRLIPGDTAEDRGQLLLSLALVLLALLFMAGAISSLLLAILAVMNKEMMDAVIFLALAIGMLLANRFLVHYDQWQNESEEKRKKKFRQSNMKEITVDGGTFGQLKFTYDIRMRILKLTKQQLPAFANGRAFDVISYGSNGKQNQEMYFINRYYRDKDLLIEKMCNTLYEYCRQEQITKVGPDRVNQRFVRDHLYFSKLTIHEGADGSYASLCGECDSSITELVVRASLKDDSEQYEYSMGPK